MKSIGQSLNISTNQTTKANLLVVDDTPQNLELLSTILKQQSYGVRCAKNGEIALRVANSGWPDLILLDIKMPEMNGYEVCQQLKAAEITREIPVIFLSALDDAFDKVKAFTVGGVDYVSKPFQAEEVLVRIANHLNIRAAKNSLDQINTQLEQRVEERTAELALANRKLVREIAERKEAQEHLEEANQELAREVAERQSIQKKLLHLALHDSLTNLPNRALLLKRLKKVMEQSKQNPDYLFVVMFLDCDRFKLINDSLGHIVGDRVLMTVARRLESCISPKDTLARLGGDEFAILLEDLRDLEQAKEVAQHIQKKLTLPFQIDQHKFFLSASLGIVPGEGTYELSEHLLRDADTAMYRAKAKGKAGYEIFEPDMHHNALAVLRLETDLQLAITQSELFVHYQPIVSLDNQKIVGFEVLVRWMHPIRGMVYPGEFISVAEDTGLIIPIGLWVLREACRQIRIWQQKYANEQLRISVNLSVRQFAQSDLIDQIDFILQETGLDSQSLTLEITESAIMDNAELATEILQQLRERQIQLSIDDFGTGYSSLSYLHRFPVDNLKIDRSFVNAIGDNQENLEIVQAIVTLAHHLEMTVIAEGIETANQFEVLKNLDCEKAQGYFFAKPMSSELVEAALEENALKLAPL